MHSELRKPKKIKLIISNFLSFELKYFFKKIYDRINDNKPKFSSFPQKALVLKYGLKNNKQDIRAKSIFSTFWNLKVKAL